MPVERAKRLGNPNRRPLPPETAIELIPASSFPDPPKTLLSAGKKRWIQVHQFAAQWVKPDLDEGLLLLACEVADDRLRLQRKLKEEGHFIKVPIVSSSGEIVAFVPKAHPARNELHKAMLLEIKLLSLLGLTPVDRSRLKLTEAQAENEFDKWLKNRQAG
jgi:P27 family predicted phage terminase small subunit